MNTRCTNKIVLVILFLLISNTVLAGLFGKDRAKDEDIVLMVESMGGAGLHMATFNGNSASKSGDCKLIAQILTEKYSRKYQCKKYQDVKSKFKYTD
jgi:hypothetical protein